MTELAGILEEIKSSFEAYKKTNDERLEELKKGNGKAVTPDNLYHAKAPRVIGASSPYN